MSHAQLFNSCHSICFAYAIFKGKAPDTLNDGEDATFFNVDSVVIGDKVGKKSDRCFKT